MRAEFSTVLGDFVREIVRFELARGGASQRPFSQRDGERPPGAGRIKYLRTWRRARDAGDGAWAEGRARLMTPECWAKWSRSASRPTLAKAPASAAPTLLDELGAKRVAS
jgi:hypothetical protein